MVVLALEFGTASQGEPGIASGTPYEIDPVKALVLSWPSGDGGRVYRAHVLHPGIKPRAFVRKVLPAIQKDAAVSIVNGLVANNYNPAAAQSALDEAMQRAVTALTDSLAAETSSVARAIADGGTGKTAAELFQDQVQIKSE